MRMRGEGVRESGRGRVACLLSIDCKGVGGP